MSRDTYQDAVIDTGRLTLYAVASPGGDNFIAVGTDGSLLRSDNAGRTWRAARLQTSATLTAITMRGRSGYIVGERGRAFATDDGGDTWQRVRLGTDRDLEAVCLASDGTYYIAGQGGRLFRTVDGGATWSQLPPPCAKTLTGLAFQDGQYGYAVGTDGIVLETIDGGMTWRRLDFPVHRTLSTIHFTSARVGYVCGIEGTLSKTTTAGGPHIGPLPRWLLLDLDLPNHLRDMAFFDDDNGFVVGNGEPYTSSAPGLLLRTNDGAATWEHVAVPATDALLSICFSGPDIGCIVGASGNILYTLDGGVTWERAVAAC
jgi:photosystem II stability/assembly factor-like uncharacterized protein